MKEYPHQIEAREYPFTKENLYSILDCELDYDYLKADLDFCLQTPIDEWLSVSYQCDPQPRYYTIAASNHIVEYLRSLFIPEVVRDRVGWLYFPPETMGPFHYDTPTDSRHTSINLDMKFDTGAGLFFLENPPNYPGKVVPVDYPADKLVALNIQEGHMIINESPTPRILLAISSHLYYHEIIELINNGEFYND